MTKLILHTKINAPIERCFALSLSVDLHKISTSQTNEKVIAGVSTGLVKLNDVITWEGRHLGVTQKFTSKIVAMKQPTYFADEMQKGAFKNFYHQHFFKEDGGVCIMTDELEMEAPLGILGKIAMALVVRPHIEKFLVQRNQIIKQVAESEEWKKYLKPDTL